MTKHPATLYGKEETAMKNKNNAGFSLVEVLVAIVLLGTLVVPICSSLMLTFRLNEKTDTLLQSQLDVSSAAETLMAVGIDEDLISKTLRDNFGTYSASTEPFRFEYKELQDSFPDVTIHVSVIPISFFPDAGESLPYKAGCDSYPVEIASTVDQSIVVTTQIREEGAGR